MHAVDGVRWREERVAEIEPDGGVAMAVVGDVKLHVGRRCRRSLSAGGFRLRHRGDEVRF
jgi:hypothetical protein